MIFVLCIPSMCALLFLMKLLIGVVGEKGSGKETVGSLILEHATPLTGERVRSSDILRETLTLWSLPSTRLNLQYLAIIMNGHYGEGTLSKALRPRIEKSSSDIVIFDGARWKSDEKLIRSFKKNLIVYVEAHQKVRFERLKSRNEKKGEGGMSFKQFMREEKVKTETEIKKIGRRADIVISNNTTVEDLKRQVEKAWKEKIEPALDF